MILGKITSVVSLGEFEGNSIFRVGFKLLWLVPRKYTYYVDQSGRWNDVVNGDWDYGRTVEKAVKAFRVRQHIKQEHELMKREG